MQAIAMKLTLALQNYVKIWIIYILNHMLRYLAGGPQLAIAIGDIGSHNIYICVYVYVYMYVLGPIYIFIYIKRHLYDSATWGIRYNCVTGVMSYESPCNHDNLARSCKL